MNRDRLDRIAERYTARWESSEATARGYLERKIREHCEATAEDASSILDLIPQVIEKLVERGYVNDERFAREMFDRLRRQGRSRADMQARLRAKGIPESKLRPLFEDNDFLDYETQAAWRVARLRRLGPYCADPEIRQRDREHHIGVLARRGFEIETAQNVIDAKLPNEPH